MAKASHRGSCHCKAVRYEVEIDLTKGTERCNCSICWKARAWFAIVQEEDFKLLTSPDAMGEYRWVPEGKSEPFLTYRFCKHCGVRIHAAGDQASLGGKFYALHVPTLDDAHQDELAAAPLKFNDNLHGRPDRTPEDTRLL
ncbi:GFA family protein [Hyalangium rubrum]|uniref:GFA family protein n=1 Tax=Hyalangium rubrum TaxID=3103134 RepID=A0ABU5HIS4_9BACT|nr:GFA family protein [Hyalangium sp. s54d21]MDY7233261.1 GFA family protein [Hyalangium sp. s54d21]